MGYSNTDGNDGEDAVQNTESCCFANGTSWLSVFQAQMLEFLAGVR